MDFYLPPGHELEVTVFDERNLVVCQFDATVLHNYPDLSIILRTDDFEEADVLLYEYQNYELKFLCPDPSIKKVELEWSTVDPMRMILYDTDLSPVVRRYYPGGEAWNIYRELESLGRQPSSHEFCIKLQQVNSGYLSRVSYVPASYQDPMRTCLCQGQTRPHRIGAIDDCDEILDTTRRLEYNPFVENGN